MITKIVGEKYNFQIISNSGRFYIEAQHKHTLRFSFINDLNPILSEFNIKGEDPKVAESQWIVSKEEARIFAKDAKEFLLNGRFRDYLEEKLDEDRRCSEWENIRSRGNKKQTHFSL